MSFKYDVLGKVRFGFELEDILKLKGIEDINSFLNPTIKNTESELLFDNIEKARDVFVKHIENKSVIDLLVDCDVDGFTSASNIYQYIKRINSNIEIRCFIHKGKIHGLSEFVDSMCEDDSKLIIVPEFVYPFNVGILAHIASVGVNWYLPPNGINTEEAPIVPSNISPRPFWEQTFNLCKSFNNAALKSPSPNKSSVDLFGLSI